MSCCCNNNNCNCNCTMTGSGTGTTAAVNNGYSYLVNNGTHVHEVQGVTKVSEVADVAHVHRLATVTSRPIPVGCNNHVHEVNFSTDTFDGHQHCFSGRTSTAIQVGDRHVHFLKSLTPRVEGHRHEFRVATFIENPVSD